MKKIILILFLLFYINESEGNRVIPYPGVYAVCQIELTNGKIEEGFIPILNGGLRYSSNGFYIKYNSFDDRKSLKLFSINEFELVINGREDIFYLQNRSSRHPVTIVEGSDNILKRIYEEKFVINKKIEINKRLVSHYPTDDLHPAAKKIKIKNIKRFRLLSNPSEKWLSQIAREFKSVEMKKGYNEAIVWSPRWYHNIMKNQEFREEINNRLIIK